SQALRDAHIDPIFLLAPTSTTERINLIANAGSGFVYYVSLRGVTGATHLDVAAVKDQLQAIRTQTTLPVGVGFGINSPETAAAVASVADAVVVGSALVNRIGDLAEEREKIMTDVPGFLATLRSAMDQVGAAA
ncbi:MAG: tryptophan synthase subunit alpha, partial [Acidiferrobacterales bacterium]